MRGAMVTESHESLIRRGQNPPDFVVKLFQMIQNEDPSLIGWDDGRILMNNPPQLAAEILPKYFRHSRFSSFQRQLNNFGFKKIEGKGKLTPCIYGRDELRGQAPVSILSIRRRIASDSDGGCSSEATSSSSFSSSSSPRKVGGWDASEYGVFFDVEPQILKRSPQVEGGVMMEQQRTSSSYYNDRPRVSEGSLSRQSSSESSLYSSSQSSLNSTGSLTGGIARRKHWEAFPSARFVGWPKHHKYDHSASITESLSSMASAYESHPSDGALLPIESKEDLSNVGGNEIRAHDGSKFNIGAGPSYKVQSAAEVTHRSGGEAIYNDRQAWQKLESLYLPVNSTDGATRQERYPYVAPANSSGRPDDEMPIVPNLMQMMPGANVSTNDLLDTLDLLEGDNTSFDDLQKDKNEPVRLRAQPPQSHENVSSFGDIPIFPAVREQQYERFGVEDHASKPLYVRGQQGYQTEWNNQEPTQMSRQPMIQQQRQLYAQSNPDEDWSPATLNAMLRGNPYNIAAQSQPLLKNHPQQQRQKQEEQPSQPLTASLFGKQRVLGISAAVNANSGSMSSSYAAPSTASKTGTVPTAYTGGQQSQSINEREQLQQHPFPFPCAPPGPPPQKSPAVGLGQPPSSPPHRPDAESLKPPAFPQNKAAAPRTVVQSTRIRDSDDSILRNQQHVSTSGNQATTDSQDEKKMPRTVPVASVAAPAIQSQPDTREFTIFGKKHSLVLSKDIA